MLGTISYKETVWMSKIGIIRNTYFDFLTKKTGVFTVLSTVDTPVVNFNLENYDVIIIKCRIS